MVQGSIDDANFASLKSAIEALQSGLDASITAMSKSSNDNADENYKALETTITALQMQLQSSLDAINTSLQKGESVDFSSLNETITALQMQLQSSLDTINTTIKNETDGITSGLNQLNALTNIITSLDNINETLQNLNLLTARINDLQSQINEIEENQWIIYAGYVEESLPSGQTETTDYSTDEIVYTDNKKFYPVSCSAAVSLNNVANKIIVLNAEIIPMQYGIDQTIKIGYRIEGTTSKVVAGNFYLYYIVIGKEG